MSIRKRNRPSLYGEKTNYWLSYSDLMSGLLLVFILLLVVSMFHYAAFVKIREKKVAEKDKILKEQEIRLLAFEEQKRSLIAALKKELEDVHIQIDSLTGVMRIGESVLFEEDQYEIRPKGRAYLNMLFDKYVNVVLSPQYRDAVSRIVIEGHTNSRGSYLHNLTLSQQRANSVMRAWLDQAKDTAILEQKITASGRSWADLVYDRNGKEDPVRSRRIEVAFQLKESELMRSVYEKVRESGH